MVSMEELLNLMVQRGGSDLHLSVGAPPKIRVDGKPTIWGQQADPFTLAPVAGRNFEPPALATGESADLLFYLMQLPDPTPAELAAVHAGVAWLRKTAIVGFEWTGKGEPDGRRLVDKPGAGPLWARYYDTSGRPVSGLGLSTYRPSHAQGFETQWYLAIWPG